MLQYGVWISKYLCSYIFVLKLFIQFLLFSEGVCNNDRIWIVLVLRYLRMISFTLDYYYHKSSISHWITSLVYIIAANTCPVCNVTMQVISLVMHIHHSNKLRLVPRNWKKNPEINTWKMVINIFTITNIKIEI